MTRILTDQGGLAQRQMLNLFKTRLLNNDDAYSCQLVVVEAMPCIRCRLIWCNNSFTSVNLIVCMVFISCGFLILSVLACTIHEENVT